MNQSLIYLASASPRRAELLRQIGVQFRVMPVDVDETPRPGEAAEDYVSRLADEKAQRAWRRLGERPGIAVLAADTAVVLGGEILGKPRDQAHGTAMLGRLSGQVHEVLTAVALCRAERLDRRLSRSRVRFRSISDGERETYWHTGEPRDKAGGYAIQGLGALFAASLQGSFSGVVGLPLFETAELLALAGVRPLAAGDTG